MKILKQYFDIICDETNVKEISIYIVTTEKGKITIVYNRKDRNFKHKLNNEVIYSEKLEEKTKEIIENYLFKKI